LIEGNFVLGLEVVVVTVVTVFVAVVGSLFARFRAVIRAHFTGFFTLTGSYFN